MSQGPWRHHSLVIPEYARRFPSHRVLIETGTGEIAENSAKMAPLFDLVFTVDIDPEIAFFAMEKFKNTSNVIPILADSEEIINKLVSLVGQPAIWFLDGHWDHDTLRRRGKRDTPIETELQNILPCPIPHIVLIDDARFFLDQERDESYPAFKVVEEMGIEHDFDVKCEDDVIRLVPRSLL